MQNGREVCSLTHTGFQSLGSGAFVPSLAMYIRSFSVSEFSPKIRQ